MAKNDLPLQNVKKAAVLNLSGNVGKTTLAKNLLAAWMAGAKVISVESVNNNDALQVDSIEVEELKASQFKQIYHALMFEDQVILDVGASNVAQFMEELTKFRSAIGELDLIVIPTVPAEKQQKDTIATIEWLHKLGVAPQRIRVVFNQYTGTNTLAETYAHVLGYAMDDDGKNKACWLPQPVVESNEVYEMISTRRRTVREVAQDTTDWNEKRAAAKANKDMQGLEEAIDGQMAHDLAVTAMANLEKAFEDLLAPYTKAAAKK